MTLLREYWRRPFSYESPTPLRLGLDRLYSKSPTMQGGLDDHLVHRVQPLSCLTWNGLLFAGFGAEPREAQLVVSDSPLPSTLEAAPFGQPGRARVSCQDLWL